MTFITNQKYVTFPSLLTSVKIIATLKELIIMSKSALHQIFNPSSIAVVGVSNDISKMGTMHYLNIITSGYRGKVYIIHHREKEVLGKPAYKSPLDLPEAPDLAIFVIPSKNLLPVFEEFGKIGTKHAIIITAGFRETGEEGAKLEKQLFETAKKYGIRFVGPNCMGVVNSHLPLNVTVLPMFDYNGKLGFISQSGTYVTQVLPYLHKKGIKFSKAISLGNSTDICINDALEYLGDDSDTGAIAIYIEAIRDIENFLKIARKVTRKKPVLAQYVGGSKGGAKSGASHTGAMAGPDNFYDGIFRQTGIIRAYSVEELYYKGWTLATQPIPAGNRVGIVSNSGGPATAMADTLTREGMEVPEFSEELQNKIKPLIPPHGSSKNPIDITFAIEIELMGKTLPKLVAESGEVDAMVIHGIMDTGFMKSVYNLIKDNITISYEEFEKIFFADVEFIKTIPEKYKIPVTVSSFMDHEDHAISELMKGDIPVLDSPEKAAWGILTLKQYREVREKKLPDFPEKIPAPPMLAEKIINSIEEFDEYHAKQLLKAYGIPVPEEYLAKSSLEAIEYAEKIGFPVVLKGSHPSLQHKTEAGMVFLNVKTPAEVREIFRKIKENNPVYDILAAPMVKYEREFMAGMIRKEGFPPCMMFGLGGIYTEVFKDNVTGCAPLTVEDAKDMVESIKSKKLLGAFRGYPPVDIEKMAEVLVQLSYLSLNFPEIKEIDLNPIVTVEGKPVVLDALVVK